MWITALVRLSQLHFNHVVRARHHILCFPNFRHALEMEAPPLKPKLVVVAHNGNNDWKFGGVRNRFPGDEQCDDQMAITIGIPFRIRMIDALLADIYINDWVKTEKKTSTAVNPPAKGIMAVDINNIS